MTSAADFLHLLNPNNKNHRAIEKYFKKNPSLQFVWVERQTHPTHLETIIEWAINRGISQIAVWGGDGTFSRVVQALFSFNVLSTTRLALVPVGTCNDFARRVGLHPWQKMFNNYFSDPSTWENYDLGLLTMESGKRVFVNNAGFGRTPNAVRNKISNPIRDILNFKERRMEVEWETSDMRTVETLRPIMGIVFNAPYFSKGLHFNKDISPQDGLLSSVLIPKQNSIKMLARFVMARLGASLSRLSDIKFDGESIKMEFAEEIFPQVDGESASLRGVRDLSFDVIQGALKLLIPGKEK